MTKLTKREDQIMQVVWKLQKAFIRDILEAFPDPQPHYNTVATLVKILVKKGFLTSELLGITHQYQVTDEYRKNRADHLGSIKKEYFEGSFSNMVAHFAKGEKLSEVEAQELIDIIKSKKTK